MTFFNHRIFLLDSDQELTTVTFLRVEGTKSSKPLDDIEHNMDTGIAASGSGVAANINEDSLEAASAILEAASINSTADQGNGSENSGISSSNPIAMLNQEEIRYKKYSKSSGLRVGIYLQTMILISNLPIYEINELYFTKTIVG